MQDDAHNSQLRPNHSRTQGSPPQYLDDPTILDETVLWRRIRPEQVVRGESGIARPSSQGFRDRPNDDSVLAYIADEVPSVEILLDEKHAQFLLAAFRARIARESGRAVMRWDPEGDNPGHVVLFQREPFTRSQVNKLAGNVARSSWWIVGPR